MSTCLFKLNHFHQPQNWYDALLWLLNDWKCLSEVIGGRLRVNAGRTTRRMCTLSNRRAPLSSYHGNSSWDGQGDVLCTHFSCGSGVDRDPHGGSSAAADALAPFRCVLRSQVVGAIPSESERRGGQTRSRGVAAMPQGWRVRRRPRRWTVSCQRRWRRSQTAQMPSGGREEEDRGDALSEWMRTSAAAAVCAELRLWAGPQQRRRTLYAHLRGVASINSLVWSHPFWKVRASLPPNFPPLSLGFVPFKSASSFLWTSPALPRIRVRPDSVSRGDARVVSMAPGDLWRPRSLRGTCRHSV